MRATFRKVIALLDGTPTGTRGQSLVELTLTLPVLMVMLMGLTEIGWYANNYLNLLDIVREGGRTGATLDPTLWVDGEEKNYHRLDCDELSDFFNTTSGESNTTQRGPDGSYGYFIGQDRPLGYYDFVACRIIANMPPLEFDNDKDDIVVSVFPFFVQNRGTPSARVRMQGRYPARTNECAGEIDPFDINGNGVGNDIGELTDKWDAGSDNVRGYVFRGNHKVEGTTSCLGSEFTTKQVEDMLDFQGDPDRARKIEQVPNFGLVLVEIYWTHTQLLGLPWFNIGPLEDGQVIHVWTFFPVSAAEPDVD